MERREEPIFELACAVPFRRTADRVEFCLVCSHGSSYWEFPHCFFARGECARSAAELAAQRCGRLLGQVVDELPLDRIESHRGEQNRSILAFLFEVTDVADVPAEGAPMRVLWCLPEEARLRIRRKPLRRLIDLALRRLETVAGNSPA